MIFGRRTVTVHGKLLEGGLGRKLKWRVAEDGRAKGRQEKVRSFGGRRRRSLEHN